MDAEVLREGVLKKKKSRVNTWADRYFKLKHNCLEYYVKANETVSDISFLCLLFLRRYIVRSRKVFSL